jgi:general secretion pathway protein G
MNRNAFPEPETTATTPTTMSAVKWIKAVARSDSGMTILELLVVVAILGVLATLGGAQVLGYLDRARADTARLQIRELVVALDVFEMDVGRPPTPEEGLEALVVEPAGAEGWRGPYLRGRGLLRDPWGRAYLFGLNGDAVGYEVRSLGADGRTGGEDEDTDISSRDLP